MSIAALPNGAGAITIPTHTGAMERGNTKRFAGASLALLLLAGGLLLPIYYRSASPPIQAGTEQWSLIAYMRSTAVVAAVGLAIVALLDRNARFLFSRFFIFLMPFVFLAFAYVMRLTVAGDNEMYRGYTREDGPVEWLSAFALLAAAALLALSSRRAFSHNALLAASALAILSGFVAWLGLEEISYGQRLFGWETPDRLAQLNYQSEINIHNLSGLEPIMDQAGPLLLLTWAFFGWAVCFVLARLVPRAGRPHGWVELLAPPPFLTSYFIPYAVWFRYCCAPGGMLVSRDQEVAECVLALAFMSYATWAWVKARALGTRQSTSVLTASVTEAPALSTPGVTAEQFQPSQQQPVR